MAAVRSTLWTVRCEEAWIRDLLAGDEGAFRRLVEEYHGLAYGLAYRALGDPQDAEEVAQDAFVKVHGALGGFRGDSSLKTWVLRIVWRLALNRRRDRARSAWQRLGLHAGGEAERRAGAADDPELRLLSRETALAIRRVVDDLPPALREVVILNSFEELGYDEIARILGVPLGTVSSRIHTARRHLAEALRRRGIL